MAKTLGQRIGGFDGEWRKIESQRDMNIPWLAQICIALVQRDLFGRRSAHRLPLILLLAIEGYSSLVVLQLSSPFLTKFIYKNKHNFTTMMICRQITILSARTSSSASSARRPTGHRERERERESLLLAAHLCLGLPLIDRNKRQACNEEDWATIIRSDRI